LEDAVTAYAWSPDASVLAVGFTVNGDEFLGGVRLPSLGSPDAPTKLAPIPAFVEGNLVWVGDDAVAYHAELQPDPDNPGQHLPDNPDHISTPFYARLGAASFQAPQFTLFGFEPTVFLQPARDGFWIINSLSSFFPMTGSPTDAVLHFGVMLVAPSGNYSATLSGETLQIFSASGGVFSPVLATSKPGEACPMPLAWSQQDRVACLANVDADGLGSHGEVRFFDLEAASDVLTMSTLGGFCEDGISANDGASCTARRQGYGYGTSDAVGAPREFSASGRWFAFTRAIGDSAYVYWADLEANPVELSDSLFWPLSGSPDRLAFSPDSQKLGIQVGETLLIQPLSGVSRNIVVSRDLTPVDSCIEELPTAPHRYCGNTSLDASFRWAPDSTAIAYRAGGSVTVVDASQASHVTKYSLPVPLCEAPLCSGSFEFQP
jgi:hypothetical protein